MKTAYDLKSFQIGVFLTARVVLTLGATKDELHQVGRIRVETNGNHVFVVDTVTDQVLEKCVRVSEGTTSQYFAEPKLRAHKTQMWRKLVEGDSLEVRTAMEQPLLRKGLGKGRFYSWCEQSRSSPGTIATHKLPRPFSQLTNIKYQASRLFTTMSYHNHIQRFELAW